RSPQGPRLPCRLGAPGPARAVGRTRRGGPRRSREARRPSVRGELAEPAGGSHRRRGAMISAIIPAKAHSHRVPGKNLRPLGGRPLVAWTIEAAMESSVDGVYVSTDS